MASSSTTPETQDKKIVEATETSEVTEVTIVFEGDEVRTNLKVQNYKFHDLDAWVRSRFGVKAYDQLRYMDKLGAECIPDKSTLLNKDIIHVKKIKKEAKKPSIFEGRLFAYFFLTCTLSVAYVVINVQSSLSDVIPLKEWCSRIDQILISLGLSSKNGVALEAFVAMVTWSLTYLFIRRLCNPETSRSTFDKYSADSFFGGLAAAGAVIVKSAVNMAVSGK